MRCQTDDSFQSTEMNDERRRRNQDAEKTKYERFHRFGRITGKITVGIIPANHETPQKSKAVALAFRLVSCPTVTGIHPSSGVQLRQDDCQEEEPRTQQEGPRARRPCAVRSVGCLSCCSHNEGVMSGGGRTAYRWPECPLQQSGLAFMAHVAVLGFHMLLQ